MKPGEFVTADHHLGHKNIIKYTNRPFEHVDEMDDFLIRAWNEKVPPGAIVYHLGDFSMRKPQAIRNYLRRLNGTIRLVRGNHDRGIKGDLLGCFDWVKDYYESKCVDGTKVVMCHYAFQVWNKSHHGAWDLHGHSHNSLHQPDWMKRMDVGVDCHPNYEPFSFGEIVDYMEKKDFKAQDHHGSERK